MGPAPAQLAAHLARIQLLGQALGQEQATGEGGFARPSASDYSDTFLAGGGQRRDSRMGLSKGVVWTPLDAGLPTIFEPSENLGTGLASGGAVRPSPFATDAPSTSSQVRPRNLALPCVIEYLDL